MSEHRSAAECRAMAEAQRLLADGLWLVGNYEGWLWAKLCARFYAVQAWIETKVEQ